MSEHTDAGVPADLFARLQAVCLALPETTVQTDAFAHTFRVRRHVFAHLLAPDDGRGGTVPMLIVRADPVERDVLTAIGHPYFATRNSQERVGLVLEDGTDWDEVRELVTESYRLLAPKKLVALLPEP